MKHELDPIVIRPFAPDDRARVEAFFDRMHGEAELFFNTNDVNRRPARAFFKGTARCTDYFLAEDNGVMAGYVFLRDMDSVPELGIAVDEAYQHRGLGRRLMEYAERHARQAGRSGILLRTHPANLRAQMLYYKAGYERIGTALNGELLFLRRLRAEKRQED